VPTAFTLERSTSSRFIERENAEEELRWHSRIGNPARLVSRYCTFIPKFWDDFGVSLLASDRMLCIGRSPPELLAGQCGFTRPRRSGGLRAPPRNSPAMERRQRAQSQRSRGGPVSQCARGRNPLQIGEAQSADHPTRRSNGIADEHRSRSEVSCDAAPVTKLRPTSAAAAPGLTPICRRFPARRPGSVSPAVSSPAGFLEIRFSCP
jgi:hypothetical protein